MFLATSLASADASASFKLLRASSLIAFLDATFAFAEAYSAASFDAFVVAASKISFFSDNIFLASSKASKAFSYASLLSFDFKSSNSFFAIAKSLAALSAAFSASAFSFSALTTFLILFFTVDLNSLTLISSFVISPSVVFKLFSFFSDFSLLSFDTFDFNSLFILSLISVKVSFGSKAAVIIEFKFSSVWPIISFNGITINFSPLSIKRLLLITFTFFEDPLFIFFNKASFSFGEGPLKTSAYSFENTWPLFMKTFLFFSIDAFLLSAIFLFRSFIFSVRLSF